MFVVFTIIFEQALNNPRDVFCNEFTFRGFFRKISFIRKIDSNQKKWILSDLQFVPNNRIEITTKPQNKLDIHISAYRRARPTGRPLVYVTKCDDKNNIINKKKFYIIAVQLILYSSQAMIVKSAILMNLNHVYLHVFTYLSGVYADSQ